MDIVREPVIPSPVENATVVKAIVNGVHRAYEITPNEGYVLHDKACDFGELDPETMEETIHLGYSVGTCSCAASYDFTTNPREFYAIPEDNVPADQIFGVGNNDHEVM